VRLEDASQFTDGVIANESGRASSDELEDMNRLQRAQRGCTRTNLLPSSAKSRRGIVRSAQSTGFRW
jgi:hypothetical protein